MKFPFYPILIHTKFLSTIHNLIRFYPLQRERKQRKLYSDLFIDDDQEGARGFSVAEKLESSRFAQTGMVREMKGTDLSIS